MSYLNGVKGHLEVERCRESLYFDDRGPVTTTVTLYFHFFSLKTLLKFNIKILNTVKRQP